MQWDVDADDDHTVDLDSREQMVQAFVQCVPYVIYNIAHVVLDDGNLTDHYIDGNLDWMKYNAEEYMQTFKITEDDVRIVKSFLRFLKTLPEPVEDEE